jgi:hypothetical protein
MRDEFLITRQGKQYVLFAGLLDEAHNRGLRGIDTELIQVPDDTNGHVAIVKATCEMEDGRRFSGIGDASPENVGRNIAPHVIRMAETRAKARALRDAVNVGATALEELSDGDDGGAAHAPQAGGFGRTQPRGRGGAGGSGAASGATPIRGGRPRAQEPPDGGADEAPPPEDNGQAEKPAASSGSRRGGAGKARKSQVDLLKTLAVEWRGENGVERLENRIGKPLTDLTRAEADEWIDRLTPEGRE